LPEFDVRICRTTHIGASPGRVYSSLWNTDFDYWGITRALYAFRTLPSLPLAPLETWRRFRKEFGRQRFTLEDMLAEGFTLLGEQPNEELLLGTVGRFWLARGELNATSPTSFREHSPPGTAKAAMNFTVGPSSAGITELRTETRVLCADLPTKRRFIAYWRLIKPFSGLIRNEMLTAVRSAAESIEFPNPQSATTRL